MNFFKQLSEDMLDRQEVRLNVKKIGDDIVVMVVPNYKDDGKTIQMSGTPEEVDNGFFNELKNFQDSLTEGFQTEVIGGDQEEEETSDKNPKAEKSEKATGKATAKKSGTKSKVSKATETVKEEPTETSEEGKLEEKPEEEKPKAEVVAVIEEPKQEETKVIDITKESHFDELMAQGKALFEDRKYEDAAMKYHSALQVKPEDTKAKAAYDNAMKWHKAVARLSNV